ncbi:MAG: type II toxin-antitoxin system prevent-host-death family antitoxin [Candidatus Eremiobacteraeota bacterium]|nr:type II toxin-antitoxin system prevent-host-death family antitoxin [Candidatus Eremiobacteraeota bacterium]
MSIAEVKANFSSLAREVERGTTVVVTRRGKPVLEIRPVQRMTVDQAVAGIRSFRKSEGFNKARKTGAPGESPRRYAHRGHKR